MQLQLAAEHKKDCPNITLKPSVSPNSETNHHSSKSNSPLIGIVPKVA